MKEISLIRSAVGSLSSVGFLKFLKEAGFFITGTDITAESVGRFFVDAFFEVPKADDEDEVVKKYEEIIYEFKSKWLISGPENEILVLAGNEEKFLKAGCRLFHPDFKTLCIITDKMKFYK